MKSTKKVIALMLMVALLTMGLTACKKEEKIIVMATEATFRPYEYMQGSEIVGVDVEIAKEVAKELGAELVVDGMDFNSIIMAVKSDKADFGAAGMSVTAERLEQVDFSIEYATSTQVILTTVDSGIVDASGLSGKVVGVQMSTTADLEYSDSEAYPDIEVTSFKKYTDAIMELNNGRIDAIILDSIPAQAIAEANEGFIICEEELFTDSYAIAVKKGNTELLEVINQVLTRLMEEGKIEEYTQQHLVD